MRGRILLCSRPATHGDEVRRDETSGKPFSSCCFRESALAKLSCVRAIWRGIRLSGHGGLMGMAIQWTWQLSGYGTIDEQALGGRDAFWNVQHAQRAGNSNTQHRDTCTLLLHMETAKAGGLASRDGSAQDQVMAIDKRWKRGWHELGLHLHLASIAV